MKKRIYRLPKDQWYIERIMYAVAGIFVLGGVTLGFLWTVWGFYFAGFVGFMLTFFSFTGYCPMAMILKKLFPHLSEMKK